LNTATGKSYLTLFDIKNQFKRFGNSDKGDHYINASDYNSLFEDSKGRMWTGSNNGIYEYATAGDHFILISLHPILQIKKPHTI
jgi:ligand-binding sensor domain-containing protein